jgi:hypothetical protein
VAEVLTCGGAVGAGFACDDLVEHEGRPLILLLLVA